MKVLVLAAAAALALGACSSSGGAPTAAGTVPARRSLEGSRAPGGYAFTTRDAPLTNVLADASASGRPALLFFWTSW